MKFLALFIVLLSATLLHAEDVTIIALGDSFTIGNKGFDDAELKQPIRPYPTILSEALGRPVANWGKGGRTSAQARKLWLNTATPADKAGIVIMAVGTNDSKNPDSASLVADVQAVLDTLTSQPKKFILVLHPHSSETASPEQKANIVSHHTALKAAFPDYAVDLWDFHVDANGTIAPTHRRFNDDGKRDNNHPNTLWNAEVASRVRDRIQASAWLPAPAATPTATP